MSNGGLESEVVQELKRAEKAARDFMVGQKYPIPDPELRGIAVITYFNDHFGEELFDRCTPDLISPPPGFSFADVEAQLNGEVFEKIVTQIIAPIKYGSRHIVVGADDTFEVYARMHQNMPVINGLFGTRSINHRSTPDGLLLHRAPDPIRRTPKREDQPIIKNIIEASTNLLGWQEKPYPIDKKMFGFHRDRAKYSCFDPEASVLFVTLTNAPIAPNLERDPHARILVTSLTVAEFRDYTTWAVYERRDKNENMTIAERSRAQRGSQRFYSYPRRAS